MKDPKALIDCLMQETSNLGNHERCYLPIGNHLNSRLVWYLNGIFVSGCQMVRYLNGGLKTELKKTVYGTKYPEFK